MDNHNCVRMVVRISVVASGFFRFHFWGSLINCTDSLSGSSNAARWQPQCVWTHLGPWASLSSVFRLFPLPFPVQRSFFAESPCFLWHLLLFCRAPQSMHLPFVLLYKQLKIAFCCPWQIFSLWSGFNPPDNILAALFILALHYVFSRPFMLDTEELGKRKKNTPFMLSLLYTLKIIGEDFVNTLKIDLFSLEKYLVVELLF